MQLRATRCTGTLVIALLAVGNYRVAGAQIIPTPGFPYETYKVTNDSAVHFCKLTDSELIYSAKKSSSPKLINRNYHTGVETEFEQVNSLLAPLTGLSASDVQLSPDGHWAAWPTSRGGRDGVMVTSITGNRSRFIDTPPARVIDWAPEPNMVICFSADGAEYSRIGYYNVESGDLDSDFHIARHSGLAGLDDGKGRRFLACFCPINEHRAWSVTVPPAFKTGSTRFGLGGAVVLGMYELSNTALARTGYAIDLPQKCDLTRVIVSPHQKYAIWELGFQRTRELWISNMNGMHMRRAVTMLDEKNASYSDAEPPIADVMWLPASRKIACRVGGTLYIVTLDLDKDQPDP